MSNIVIIGSGPAGVSAALYTARAGVDTTVLTRGLGALDRAELIQNYYGFAAPISGAELERQGIIYTISGRGSFAKNAYSAFVSGVLRSKTLSASPSGQTVPQ